MHVSLVLSAIDQWPLLIGPHLIWPRQFDCQIWTHARKKWTEVYCPLSSWVYPSSWSMSFSTSSVYSANTDFACNGCGDVGFNMCKNSPFPRTSMSTLAPTSEKAVKNFRATFLRRGSRKSSSRKEEIQNCSPWIPSSESLARLRAALLMPLCFWGHQPANSSLLGPAVATKRSSKWLSAKEQRCDFGKENLPILVDESTAIMWLGILFLSYLNLHFVSLMSSFKPLILLPYRLFLSKWLRVFIQNWIGNCPNKLFQVGHRRFREPRYLTYHCKTNALPDTWNLRKFT